MPDLVGADQARIRSALSSIQEAEASLAHASNLLGSIPGLERETADLMKTRDQFKVAWFNVDRRRIQLTPPGQ